jgi:hypothetical protein
MSIKTYVIPMILLVMTLPGAMAAKKKNKAERGMLERMEAVPCGARERGITGLGSVFASAGVEHVNSDEKLCPQYLLRTDEMEYHIRPTDGKHPVVLPVGKEGEFKIKKDRMFLKVPDGDHKTRSYQVVAMKPVNGDDQSGTDAEKRKPASDDKSQPRTAERREPVNTTPPPNPATPNALTPPPAPSDPPHR